MVAAIDIMDEENRPITEAIVRTTVAKDLGVSDDEVELKEFEVGQGSAKGDNYATEMKAFRVEAIVKGRKVRKSYMAKCFPVSEFRVKFLKEASYIQLLLTFMHLINKISFQTGFFEKEVIAYTEILPCLHNLDSGISFPKIFFGDYKDKGLLIMEDLKESGYCLGDKMKGTLINKTENRSETAAIRSRRLKRPEY